MTQSQYPQLAMPIGIPTAAEGDEDIVSSNAIPLWESEEKNFYPGALTGSGGGSGGGGDGVGIILAGLEMPSIFGVEGSPIEPPSGTFVVTWQPQIPFTVLAGPGVPESSTPDVPAFRALTPGDIPQLPYIQPLNGGFAANTLIRTIDDSGYLAQQTPILVSDTGVMYNYAAKVEEHTATFYALTPEDSGKIIELNNAATITAELPDLSSVKDGWCCTVMQTGVGQVEFGGTITSYGGRTKTAGQYAAVSIWVNTDKTAYRIAGTTA